MKLLKASPGTARLGQAPVLLPYALPALPALPTTPAVPEPPREAGRWVSDAELRRTAAQAFEQGRAQGLDTGHQRALAAAQAQAQAQGQRALDAQVQALHHQLAQAQAERWQGLSSALDDQWRSLQDRLEAEVTEWTFIAVCRLLGPQSPAQVADAVRQVLAEARLAGPLTVLLHAQDLPAADLHAGPWPAGVQFGSDDRVALGGCIVQAAHQTLDARLEVQLALLRTALDDARHQRQAG